ncbi:MAG: hypothetical protein KBT88_05380 [Gammaproteobacteria bacterium]|nr:hypothetical protein [Gammaproteobacteria bacterium]MBQ0839200.1 hypothetical protein [Gammaproteobacteria bacterium]
MTNNTQALENTGFLINRQRLFIKYILAVLVDLTVLNLFNQYWEHVYIESFSISLLAAILLQLLLQITLVIEHKVASFFQGKEGLKHKLGRGLSTWAILFVSKLVILQAINFAFGNSVLFTGPIHGLVAFIIAVVAIIVAEQIITRIYRSLG